jgi:hypothetical protein
MTEIKEAGYSGKLSGVELVCRAATSKHPRVAKKRQLTPARRAQNRASQARYSMYNPLQSRMSTHELFNDIRTEATATQ